MSLCKINTRKLYRLGVGMEGGHLNVMSKKRNESRHVRVKHQSMCVCVCACACPEALRSHQKFEPFEVTKISLQQFLLFPLFNLGRGDCTLLFQPTELSNRTRLIGEP